MPRSTSPIGPRRPALAAAVLVLLLAALVGPVAAEDVEIPMDGSCTRGYTYGAGYVPDATHPVYLYRDTPVGRPDEYYILAYAPAVQGLDTIYLDGYSDRAQTPASYDLVLKQGNTEIGTGKAAVFNIYPDGASGHPVVSISIDPGFDWSGSSTEKIDLYTSDGTRFCTDDISLSAAYYSGEPHYLFVDYYVGVSATWHNIIRVVDDRFFYLDRSVGGVRYFSELSLISGSDVILRDASFADVHTPFLSYPLEYSVLDPFGQYWNGTIGSMGTDVPSFLLTLSPTTAPVGEPVSATLTAAAGAPAYDEVAWVHGDEQRTFMHNTSGWWEFSYSTYEYDIPSTETAAHTYQFATESPPGLDPPQDQVRCLVYSDGRLVQELIGRVPLTENVAKTQLAVVVIDYSGGDTPILSGATVTVKDEISKQTVPLASSDSTFHRFNAERGRRYVVTASAPGFVSSSRAVAADREIQTVEMYLSKNASVTLPDNSTQVDFLIKDSENQHLESVLISLTDQTTGQTYSGLTNQFGTRTFVVDMRHLCQFSISKAGYQGTSGTFDPAHGGTRVFTLYRDGTGPGGSVPVTVTPDHRTPEEKAESAFSIIFDNLEIFATLAGLVLLVTMIDWLVPGGGRKR
jgi:hypothetical protein